MSFSSSVLLAHRSSRQNNRLLHHFLIPSFTVTLFYVRAPLTTHKRWNSVLLGLFQDNGILDYFSDPPLLCDFGLHTCFSWLLWKWVQWFIFLSHFLHLERQLHTRASTEVVGQGQSVSAVPDSHQPQDWPVTSNRTLGAEERTHASKRCTKQTCHREADPVSDLTFIES